MIKRKFGTTGIEVSALGLGCNNFGGRIDRDKTSRVIDAALEAGINFFDTADVYGNRGGSETLIGELLGSRRNDVVLATKFGMPMDDEGRRKGGSRSYVMAAVEASLKRLRTDHIDLYYLHRPDRATPIEETLRALDDLVRAGKIRYAACSNLTGPQLEDALAIAQRQRLAPFVATQDEYNLLNRAIEPDLVPVIERHGLALIPYFPLASGLLSGKYRKGKPLPSGTRLTEGRLAERFVTEHNLDIVERLAGYCAERGHTLLELAFGWLLSHSCVASVIAGATSPEQIRQNASGLRWQLTVEEIAAVDRIARG